MVEQRPFKALAAGSSPAQPIALIFQTLRRGFRLSIVSSRNAESSGVVRDFAAHDRPKHLRLRSEGTPLLAFLHRHALPESLASVPKRKGISAG
jgi:hypothetical protein